MYPACTSVRPVIAAHTPIVSVTKVKTDRPWIQLKCPGFSCRNDKQRLPAAMHREGFRRLGERLRAAADAGDPDLLTLGRAYRGAALAARTATD